MDKILYYPVIDETRSKWKILLEKIKSWFFENIVSDINQANAILVWWWDGFMIHTMKEYFDCWKIFFGLNCGTLWFLMNDFDFQLPKTFGELDIVRWHYLDVKIVKNDWNETSMYAINDVIIWWSILDCLDFKIEWNSLSENIRWTWLVVATSLGSSGYWLSNWWPIMPVQSGIFGIMWIATKPFNYNLFNNQSIKIIPNSRHNVIVWVDWYNWKIDDVKEVYISPSEKYLELWFLSDKNFDTKRVNLSNQKLSGLCSI